jgi:hypothetical protein
MSEPGHQMDEKGRGEGGRFAPGWKGGGRPAVSKRIRQMAQQYGEEAIRGLLELAQDPDQPGAVRRAAWTDILDRGFGKPTIGEPDEDGKQPIHHTFELVRRTRRDDAG